MRKILSGVCALAMVSSIGMTAFATSEYLPSNTGADDFTSKSTQEVEINVTANKPEAETVYSVEVNWDAIEFIWNESEDKPVWHPESHTMDEISDNTWNKDEATINVLNHSNALVYYKADISEGDTNYTAGQDGVTITLEGGNASSLPADTPGSHNTSSTKAMTVKVAGTPEKAISKTVGAKVTVTVSTTDLA